MDVQQTGLWVQLCQSLQNSGKCYVVQKPWALVGDKGTNTGQRAVNKNKVQQPCEPFTQLNIKNKSDGPLGLLFDIFSSQL